MGGFGAYATLGFYQRILEEFVSNSERNYPHIIILLSEEVGQRFIKFLGQFNEHDVVLGCTEFPILARYTREKMGWKSYDFWDPLELTIDELKKKCALVRN